MNAVSVTEQPNRAALRARPGRAADELVPNPSTPPVRLVDLRLGPGGLPDHPTAQALNRAALLPLQQTMGNRAVQRLLQQARQPAASGSAIRRCGAAPCGCSEEERAKHAEVRLPAAVGPRLQRTLLQRDWFSGDDEEAEEPAAEGVGSAMDWGADGGGDSESWAGDETAGEWSSTGGVDGSFGESPGAEWQSVGGTEGAGEGDEADAEPVAEGVGEAFGDGEEEGIGSGPEPAEGQPGEGFTAGGEETVGQPTEGVVLGAVGGPLPGQPPGEGQSQGQILKGPGGSSGTLNDTCAYGPGEKDRTAIDPGGGFKDEPGDQFGIIGFTQGSAALKENHLDHLKEMVEFFELAGDNPKRKIRLIEGFTDCVDGFSKNVSIRRARAEATKTALEDLGVPPDNLGFAVASFDVLDQDEFSPDPAKGEDARRRNRAVVVRVEFVATPGEVPDRRPDDKTCPGSRSFLARILSGFTIGELAVHATLKVEVRDLDCHRGQNFIFDGHAFPALGTAISISGTSGLQPPDSDPEPLLFNDLVGEGGEWNSEQAQVGGFGPSADVVKFPPGLTFSFFGFRPSPGDEETGKGISLMAATGEWARSGPEVSLAPNDLPHPGPNQ
jgi:outer membrane protein OmpA-like peptidoglycan-associated protein